MTFRPADDDWEDRYTVNVSYRYEVGGQTFDSDRVAYDRGTSSYSANQFSNEAGAKAFADWYKVGEKAAVFYDHTDPKEATLIRGA